jgi:carbon storage regulator CsrA
MLVLSRRLSEKLIFPGVAASIEVVVIRPTAVRLGIEAPGHVTVLREELRRHAASPPGKADDDALSADARRAPFHHLVRKRLNTLVLGLALLRRQVQAGATHAGTTTLRQMEGELNRLRQELQTLCGDPSETSPSTSLPGPGLS